MIISTVCYLLAHLALTVAYFHIQELCADYPEVDKRIFRTGRFRKSIQLEIPRIGSSSSYFLSKPHNLRVAESRESESQNVFIIQTSHSLVVNFTSLNLDHEGNYSLYQFVFNSNGSNRVLIGRSRFDFNLVISGLGIGNYCQEDNQCASGRCHIICRCNSSNPIFIAGHYPNCYQARNYNQTCTNHEECMQTGGINAECYRGWRRCRCKPNTFPIRLTNNHRFCGKIAKLHQPCLYSRQCSLIGANRYCNGSYRCDCLPGYWLENGDRCTNQGFRALLPDIVTILTMLLVLIFTA